MFAPYLNNIVQGTDKHQRIGDKIYIRYITWDIEVYSTVAATKSDFPYVRVIFAKDRAGAAISAAGKLPSARLGKPDVNALSVMSDDCLPVEADYPGTSANAPAMMKITRVQRIMRPLTYLGAVA